MASIVSKITPSAQSGRGAGGTSYLSRIVRKLAHIPAFGTQGDDPVCLSALDETTLGRYGYSESQIHLMKEISLR
jgi:hypothetical protein